MALIARKDVILAAAEARGIPPTVRGIAAIAGLSQTSVRRAFKGRHVAVYTAEAIARAVGAEPAELFDHIGGGDMLTDDEVAAAVARYRETVKPGNDATARQDAELIAGIRLRAAQRDAAAHRDQIIADSAAGRHWTRIDGDG